jgi:acyl-coenzyme A synthetase/AMP-(fatty) acid ligase
LDLPDWTSPRFRLTEGGVTLEAAALAGRAARLAAEYRQAGGADIDGSSVAGLAAALVAAHAARVPLRLRRSALAPAAQEPPPGFSLLLETSGTTGAPKLVRHDPDRLLGRIPRTPAPDAVWLLSYDATGFAGLQVLLTAMAGGGRLVAAPGADVAALAALATAEGCTHASGTPSFWRGFLLAGARPPLKAITIGGEAVDQPLLDRLAERFPAARLRHIYASTEAGALFAVTDGRAGFPAAWLENGVDGVALRIRDGVLEVRSPRRALSPETDAGDWLVTGDLVEIVGDRISFRGRNDGIVNVGGVKVVPEQVEALLLSVAGVGDAAVTAVPSPITGQLLTARIVPVPDMSEDVLRGRLREALSALPPAARPRRIELVERLALAPSGKKIRMEGAA